MVQIGRDVLASDIRNCLRILDASTFEYFDAGYLTPELITLLDKTLSNAKLSRDEAVVLAQRERPSYSIQDTINFGVKNRQFF